jgi:hypothetical protein
MSSATWNASCPIALPRHTRLGHLTTIVVSCEWSIGPTLHCSLLCARLTCINDAAYLHVL